jgi:uncharacterized protein
VSGRWSLLIPAALVAALLVLPGIARFYTDWLWFQELGYSAVFGRELATRSLLFAVALGVAFAWFALNLRVALTAVPLHPVLWSGQPGVQIELPGRRQFERLGRGAVALLSIPLALHAANQWLTWLYYRHQVPFASPDPILGRDVGFYVFALPLFDWLHGFLLALVVLAAIGAGAIYMVTGSASLAGRGPAALSANARRHLLLLAAAFFALLAFGAWLSLPQYLLESSSLIHGATYTDVAARMPVARIRLFVALAAAVLAVVAAFRTALPFVVAAGLFIAISIAGGIYASALQRFVVAPNEQTRETPYMSHNIEGTRRAFALAAVEEFELTGDASLTRADIERNAATLKNVRLWDHRPLLDTFAQLQEIRPYYDFVSVDNDRYVIDGESRQVMLSARELNSSALSNRTWINERLTFTHGYGLTLGPVNQVTNEGLPVLFVRDLPPVSTAGLAISEPSIYFGELSNDYVFVKTRAVEFHYPRGDDNVTTTYTGTGGVPVASFWRRLLFALRFRSQQIVFSNDITSESRVLFHRRIAERVQRLAPFLEFDPDPYLVVADGRLFWIQDAYTTSRRYPYSTPAGGVNYIRNSVKVVIDAFHGTTTFYLADPQDPIVRSLALIFPTLLKPYAAMPANLRAHVRYPETLFALQTALYATYHMTNPTVFYNKEDQWDIPALEEGGRAEPMEPYYTIMKLPGEDQAEFIQMVPLTPRRKDNLAAWMVARSDGDRYGKLAVYRFPKQKVVFGPRQVVARINQDQVIAPQITLWNQQGSQVLQGTLLVIPIEESLLYIRPLYLKGSGSQIPELKRVIVAYQGQIVMEPTLDLALARLFGGPGAPPAPPAPEAAAAPAPGAAPRPAVAVSELAAEARAHYQRALQAQREGNWALYGEEIQKLGAVLERMRQP